MVLFALLLIGFLVYLIVSKSWGGELTPLGVAAIMICILNLYSLLLGYLRNDRSTALTAFGTKFYILFLVPLIGLRKNRFLTVRNIGYVFFVTTAVLSIFVDLIFLFCFAKGYSSTEVETLLHTIFPSGYGIVGSYPPSGVFISALLYVLYAAIASFSILLFKKHSSWKSLCLWLLLFALYLFTIVQSGSRGMIFILLVILTLLWLIRLISLFKSIKTTCDPSQKESLKIQAFLMFYIFLYLILVGLAFLWKHGYLYRLVALFSDEGIQYRGEFLSKAFPTIFSFPFLFGKGFGAAGGLVSGVHLEVDLVEVCLDQGVVGVGLWLSLSFYVLLSAIAIRKENPVLALAISSILLSNILISLSNPYETNFYGVVLIGVCYILLYKADIGDELQKIGIEPKPHVMA